MNAKGEEKWTLKLEDVKGNKVGLKITESEFDDYGPGDKMEPSVFMKYKQNRLDEEIEPENPERVEPE